MDGEREVERSDPWKQRQRAATTPQTPHEGQVRYEDRNGGFAQALEKGKEKEAHRKFSLNMRGLTRRKSIKGRERYVG